MEIALGLCECLQLYKSPIFIIAITLDTLHNTIVIHSALNAQWTVHFISVMDKLGRFQVLPRQLQSH